MTVTLLKSIEERLYKVCIDGKCTMWVTREEYSTFPITAAPAAQFEKKEQTIMAKPTTAIEKNALNEGKAAARKAFVEQRISGYSQETKNYVSTINTIVEYAKRANAQAEVLGLTASEQEDFIGSEAIKALKALVVSKA